MYRARRETRVLLLRHHRKRSAKAESSRGRKGAEGKDGGKLISGCVHLIEIIPTTFKYVTGFPFSPPRLSSSLLSSPLPHSARPLPSIHRNFDMDSSQSQRSTPEIPTKYAIPDPSSPSFRLTRFPAGRPQLSGVPGHAPSVVPQRSVLLLSHRRSNLTIIQMKCVGSEDGTKPCQRCKRANVECVICTPIQTIFPLIVDLGVFSKSIAAAESRAPSTLFPLSPDRSDLPSIDSPKLPKCCAGLRKGSHRPSSSPKPWPILPTLPPPNSRHTVVPMVPPPISPEMSFLHSTSQLTRRALTPPLQCLLMAMMIPILRAVVQWTSIPQR